MTLFEYLSVAVSLVLALGLTHLLANLRAVVEPTHRYSVHALWVAHLLGQHAILWWACWDFHDGVSWDFFRFMYVLLGPGLLYVCSTVLVPRAATDRQPWEDHFFRVHRWFFGAFILYGLWAIFLTWLLGSLPLMHPYRVMQFAVIAVFVVGFLSQSRRVHLAVVFAGLAVLLWAMLMRIRPDAFSPA